MREKLKRLLFPSLGRYFVRLKAEVFHFSLIRNVLSDLIWLFSVQCNYLAKSVLTIVQNSILAVQSWPFHILNDTWCQIHSSSLVNCLIGREGKGGKYCINYFAVKQTYTFCQLNMYLVFGNFICEHDILSYLSIDNHIYPHSPT